MDKNDKTIPSANELDEKNPAMAENENPRANENIRVTTENAQPNEAATNQVGSEITDGEGG